MKASARDVELTGWQRAMLLELHRHRPLLSAADQRNGGRLAAALIGHRGDADRGELARAALVILDYVATAREVSGNDGTALGAIVGGLSVAALDLTRGKVP